MNFQIVQQFEDPVVVNCNFTHCENACSPILRFAGGLTKTGGNASDWAEAVPVTMNVTACLQSFTIGTNGSHLL